MSNLPDGKLTPLQESFAHEYLVDLKAGSAYIRAGYKADPKRASINGKRLLDNPKVVQRIQELIDERSKATKVTAERVVLELGRIAFSDMRDFMSWEGLRVQWKNSSDLSDEAAPAVKEVYVTEREMDDGGVYRTRRLVLHDKMKALAELAKHTGISGSAGAGINVNVNFRDDQEKKKKEEMDDLYAQIEEWREDAQEQVGELEEEAEKLKG